MRNNVFLDFRAHFSSAATLCDRQWISIVYQQSIQKIDDFEMIIAFWLRGNFDIAHGRRPFPRRPIASLEYA